MKNNVSKNNQSVISLADVSKCYVNESVVSNVSFDIQAGESVVLVGHNGAGKTTLMKLMLGLTRSSSGKVRVLGENPSQKKMSNRHKTLGYLPESVAFYEAMTGLEVLVFYGRLKGVEKKECIHLLELVGLSHAEKRRVGTYSKGMRQRLGLAQAMLGEPQLLFLDEPTTGLDPSLRRQFYELIDELHKEGATSVTSSHALHEVEGRANRFMIMKQGHLIANGTLDELYQQAALPVNLTVSVDPGKASSIAERLGSTVNIAHINNQSFDLSCLNKEKMPLIRRISELGDEVNDLQIMPPKLDDIYRHFMSGSAS